MLVVSRHILTRQNVNGHQLFDYFVGLLLSMIFHYIDCALSEQSGQGLPKKKTTETLAFIFAPPDLSLSLRLRIQQLLARAIYLLFFSNFFCERCGVPLTHIHNLR